MDTWIRRRGTAERWHLVGSSLAPGLTSATCSTSFAWSEDIVIWTGDDPPPELERCTPCQVTYWIGLAQLQQPIPEPSGYATLRSAAKRTRRGSATATGCIRAGMFARSRSRPRSRSPSRGGVPLDR